MIFTRIFLLLFILVGCNRKKDNLQMMQSIDSILKTDTVYTFEIDSFKNITDTLTMQLIKKNNEGIKVFDEYITSIEDDLYTRRTYYENDGKLFYTEKRTSKYGRLSVLETFRNSDNIIDKGIQVFYEDNQPYDTIFLHYSYEYNDKLLRKMNVDYLDSNKVLLGVTNTIYNELQNPIYEYYIESNDTLRITDYSYISDSIFETTEVDKKTNTTTIQEYKKDGKYEQIISKRIFKDDKLIIEELSEMDSSGNILVLRIR